MTKCLLHPKYRKRSFPPKQQLLMHMQTVLLRFQTVTEKEPKGCSSKSTRGLLLTHMRSSTVGIQF
jgi:hypothetical protein